MCVSMKRMTICVIQLGTLEPTLSVKKASAIFCESLVILQPGLMWYTTYLLLLNFEYANYLKVSINFDVLMLKCQEEYEFYRPFFKKKVALFFVPRCFTEGESMNTAFNAIKNNVSFATAYCAVMMVCLHVFSLLNINYRSCDSIETILVKVSSTNPKYVQGNKVNVLFVLWRNIL